MKLHFANPWTTITMPWIILAAIFAANLAIWAVILLNTPGTDHADIAAGFQWSGASAYIFVYMMVVAVQAINVTFPFALGYGVTRRDFSLGTALQFVVLSAMYAAGLTILAAIETATNGWGLGGRMFTAAYFGSGLPWYAQFFVFFVLMLFFFFVGAAAAAVFVRWKATGLTFFFIGLAALAIGAVYLLSLTNSWAAVGAFFASAGLVGSYAWSLVITVISAAAGYLILSRATPRT
jgi:hypothetical protein